jgi:hypothetical protein
MSEALSKELLERAITMLKVGGPEPAAPLHKHLSKSPPKTCTSSLT